jgi:hypothetical protein
MFEPVQGEAELSPSTGYVRELAAFFAVKMTHPYRDEFIRQRTLGALYAYMNYG